MMSLVAHLLFSSFLLCNDENRSLVLKKGDFNECAMLHASLCSVRVKLSLHERFRPKIQNKNNAKIAKNPGKDH